MAEPTEACRWSRSLTWASVLWITAGAVLVVAFGSVREVALNLLIFDVMLLFIALLQTTRRRAHARLAAIGKPSGGGSPRSS